MAVVTIVGSGVIGVSWARLFANAGWEVRVSDPRPDLADIVAEHLAGLSVLVEPDLAAAADGTDHVQEAGPERIDVKHQMFATLAALLERSRRSACREHAQPGTAVGSRANLRRAGDPRRWLRRGDRTGRGRGSRVGLCLRSRWAHLGSVAAGGPRRRCAPAGARPASRGNYGTRGVALSLTYAISRPGRASGGLPSC